MITLYAIYKFINNTDPHYKYLQILIASFLFLNNFNIISDIINKNNNNAYGVSSILLFMIPCHYMIFYDNFYFFYYILAYLQCATSYIYHVLIENEEFLNSNTILVNTENKLLILHIKYIHDVNIIAICLNKHINIYMLYFTSSIITLLEQNYKFPFHDCILFICAIIFVYDDHTRLQYLLPGCLTMIKSKLYKHKLTIMERFIWHYSLGHAIYYCFS